MISRAVTAMTCVALLAPPVAMGQSADMASERARLGNQRIEAEAERQAREDSERQGPPPTLSATSAAQQPPSLQPSPAKGAALATYSAVPPATGAPAPSTPTGLTAPADADETSRALEQLRELGELKDAGYLTDEEFQRIKARILERRF